MTMRHVGSGYSITVVEYSSLALSSASGFCETTSVTDCAFGAHTRKTVPAGCTLAPSRCSGTHAGGPAGVSGICGSCCSCICGGGGGGGGEGVVVVVCSCWYVPLLYATASLLPGVCSVVFESSCSSSCSTALSASCIACGSACVSSSATTEDASPTSKSAMVAEVFSIAPLSARISERSCLCFSHSVGFTSRSLSCVGSVRSLCEELPLWDTAPPSLTILPPEDGWPPREDPFLCSTASADPEWEPAECA
mmetsp:Transcript_4928/g.12873  ORF Transcript_4928/g.12873 Transcript_4928/m.12873 type:complete len:251 (+) Transcript_4928:2188-2940(+)